MWGNATSKPVFTKFCLSGDLFNVVNCANFGIDRLGIFVCRRLNLGISYTWPVLPIRLHCTTAHAASSVKYFSIGLEFCGRVGIMNLKYSENGKFDDEMAHYAREWSAWSTSRLHLYRRDSWVPSVNHILTTCVKRMTFKSLYFSVLKLLLKHLVNYKMLSSQSLQFIQYSYLNGAACSLGQAFLLVLTTPWKCRSFQHNYFRFSPLTRLERKSNCTSGQKRRNKMNASHSSWQGICD